MIDYTEDWLLPNLFKIHGSVAGRACRFAVPSAMFALGLLILDDLDPSVRKSNDFDSFTSGTIWSAMTGTLMFTIGFRTNRAIARFWEGTGLLHQMRGEWFDTVSNCVTFSVRARRTKPEEVKRFRHTLVRLMSLAHGNALEEISDYQFELTTIDVEGLSHDTIRYLRDAHENYNFNKVELNLHLIQTLITEAFHEGVLEVPPPVLSRVFQTISRGFVNLVSTKKITDTKFPFPFVQLLIFLMVVFTFLTPLVLTTVLTNKIIATVVTFMPVFAVASLYYAAVELENPFGKDANDLPLEHFQAEMDNCLLMLLHPDADTVASIRPDCDMDFKDLIAKWQPSTFLNKSNAHSASLRPSALQGRIDKVRHQAWMTKS
eukprot:TRINITY_DN8074_c0_g2_i1.p1 TRINITY_DN8074_c0_g2~~TRINITY_DN8074_c0_g2_i1.p1  ORF type:complete len:375 (-),score=43.76 TRINITY_DN8074_c0_g2_i1:33-1157(-)